MGIFTTRLGVSDGNGGATQWVDAVVDSGAKHTLLPASLLSDVIGIAPTTEREFTLADGSKVSMPIGEARLHVQDREAFSAVIFGSEGRYLLGATTLQLLDLIPDTSNERLIPAPELPI